MTPDRFRSPGATLKTELIHQENYATREQANGSVFEYIEGEKGSRQNATKISHNSAPLRAL